MKILLKKIYINENFDEKLLNEKLEFMVEFLSNIIYYFNKKYINGLCDYFKNIDEYNFILKIRYIDFYNEIIKYEKGFGCRSYYQFTKGAYHNLTTEFYS